MGLTDVSIVFPFDESTLMVKEKEKKAKYDPGRPMDASFSPLICDVFGRWGSKAKSVMTRCAKHCHETHLSFFDRKGSFEYFSWTALDIVLQKSLHRMYSTF